MEEDKKYQMLDLYAPNVIYNMILQLKILNEYMTIARCERKEIWDKTLLAINALESLETSLEEIAAINHRDIFSRVSTANSDISALYGYSKPRLAIKNMLELEEAFTYLNCLSRLKDDEKE